MNDNRSTDADDSSDVPDNANASGAGSESPQEGAAALANAEDAVED